ncbi:hypothetical protein BH11PAT4_BH11PAT4_0340 [soil metagenome]
MLEIKNSFPGKEKDEAIFVFARPYGVAFIPVALVFLFIFIFAVMAQLALSMNWVLTLATPTVNAAILFIGIFELFGLIVFLTTVLDFYYDILIVTDRRVVDIDQEQLFFRSISELNLNDVEDVNSSVKGFFPTLFGYGTVTIQSAGEQINFVARNFRHPREIATIIADLSDQAKRGIAAVERRPETTIIGMIEDKPIESFEELATLGALMTDDPRRVTKD